MSLPDVFAANVLANNVDGGTITAGAWQTRSFSVMPINGISATLVSNRVGLPAGDYFFIAQAVAFDVNEHQLRVYDVTNDVDLSGGMGGYNSAADFQSASIVTMGAFSLAGAADIELQHRSSGTKSSVGLGYAPNFGREWSNVELAIWKG